MPKMWQLEYGGNMVVIKILVLTMLSIMSIMDLKSKRINLYFLIPFLVSGVICNLSYQLVPLTSLIGGVGIGIVLLMISFVTKGKIGSGDGIILMVTGLFLGFYDNLLLLLSATFLSAIVGAFILLKKGMNKKYEIPFIPFLLLSFAGGLIIWR